MPMQPELRELLRVQSISVAPTGVTLDSKGESTLAKDPVTTDLCQYSFDTNLPVSARRLKATPPAASAPKDEPASIPDKGKGLGVPPVERKPSPLPSEPKAVVAPPVAAKPTLPPPAKLTTTPPIAIKPPAQVTAPTPPPIASLSKPPPLPSERKAVTNPPVTAKQAPLPQAKSIAAPPVAIEPSIQKRLPIPPSVAGEPPMETISDAAPPVVKEPVPSYSAPTHVPTEEELNVQRYMRRLVDEARQADEERHQKLVNFANSNAVTVEKLYYFAEAPQELNMQLDAIERRLRNGKSVTVYIDSKAVIEFAHERIAALGEIGLQVKYSGPLGRNSRE